jgi:hypothetical protein
VAAPSPINVKQFLKVPGQLMINPADVTDPTSGTSLGPTQDVVVIRQESKHEIVAMEFGLEPVDAIRLGERWSLVAALRGKDDDALATLFPHTFTGSSSTHVGIRHPSGLVPGPLDLRAGTLLSGEAVVLRFTPDNADLHPGVVLYRALPMVAEVLEIPFSHDSEYLLQVGFLGIRDASGRVAEVALLEDMTAI